MSHALEISGLRVEAGPANAPVTLVRGVDLVVPRGSVVGLVGESGSGKTVTTMAALGLAGAGVRVSAGSVRVAGSELVGAPETARRALLGSAVGTVFQDPLSSLNPLQRVGDQVAEAIALHRGGGRRAHRDRVLELLRAVGIPGPEQRLRSYPHELSGGLRQRVAIAIALANDQALLVADEPTTALDVTVQAQILEVIRHSTRDAGRAALIITHDFGLVAEIADHVAVMYAGQVVEQGTVEQVFAAPRHPYTRGLLASRPTLAAGRRRLAAMPGRPPAPGQWPDGCAFAERCASADEVCRTQSPPSIEHEAGWSRCWHPGTATPAGSPGRAGDLP